MTHVLFVARASHPPPNRPASPRNQPSMPTRCTRPPQPLILTPLSRKLRCTVGASEVSIALGVPISRGFLPWQPSNAAHRPWSVLRTWVSGTGIRNASQKLPRACTWKVRRTTLRHPGSVSASNVRSGAQKQDSVLAAVGVRPCEEKGPFPQVAGQRGRSLEFRTRLGKPASPKQKVAPRLRQRRTAA